jgi:hypothetical protein
VSFAASPEKAKRVLSFHPEYTPIQPIKQTLGSRKGGKGNKEK